jgi:hypothetical protein
MVEQKRSPILFDKLFVTSWDKEMFDRPDSHAPFVLGVERIL